MIVFFAISGLDVLNALNDLQESEKENIIHWLYSLQVVDNEGTFAKFRCFSTESIQVFLLELTSGFQCSPTFNTAENRGKNQNYKWSHIAGTYCILNSLLILGDGLEDINREAISRSKLLVSFEQLAVITGKHFRFTYIATTKWLLYSIKRWH